MWDWCGFCCYGVDHKQPRASLLILSKLLLVFFLNSIYFTLEFNSAISNEKRGEFHCPSCCHFISVRILKLLCNVCTLKSSSAGCQATCNRDVTKQQTTGYLSSSNHFINTVNDYARHTVTCFIDACELVSVFRASHMCMYIFAV